MTEKVMYKCDICGTEYEDKSECRKCESSHRTPKSITSVKYAGFKKNPTGMPTVITVGMANGKSAVYEYKKCCG